MQGIDQSEIVVHKSGGVTFAGKDAMWLYRAMVLRNGIRLYVKTGIKPTRGVGPTQMMAMAKEYTGETYKRGELPRAERDLSVWIDTMKSAMPLTVDGEQR